MVAVATVCSSPTHPQLAARMSVAIAAAVRGRESGTGLAVSAPAAGLTCELHASRQFDSASVVKATILAALLHRDGGDPTGWERQEATWMITQSDNDAASHLWNDVGPAAFQRFLTLAGMAQTVPGPGPAWGLTRITAGNELRLLHVLTAPNSVLSQAARDYELDLMSQVEPGQRWGVSAGVPATMTVHVKNGWLPDSAADGWWINSIGCMSGNGPGYCMAVLTDANPTMDYGVQTVSGVAQVINEDLNSPLALPRAPRAAPPGKQARLARAASAHPGHGPRALPRPRSGPSPLTERGWLGAPLIAVALVLVISLAWARRRPA